VAQIDLIANCNLALDRSTSGDVRRHGQRRRRGDCRRLRAGPMHNACGAAEEIER
jgi:hypothetical protein